MYDINNLSTDQKIAQVLSYAIWTERDLKEDKITAYIKEYGIGHLHFNTGDLSHVRLWADWVQELCHEACAIPPLIGADAEQGVTHSFDFGTEQPWQMAVGQTGNPDNAFKMGLMAGRELRAAGIHMIYGPCADVTSNTLNRLLISRSYGTDPVLVGDFVCSYIKGVHQAGATVAVKHFPGHGGATKDSHLEVPHDLSTIRELQKLHLPPFVNAIEAGADAIMTGHVIFDKIDIDNLATFSPKIIRELLRDELGFKGLVLTDSLNMKAVKHQPFTRHEAGLRALNASCDIILHPSALSGQHQYLKKALQDGTLLPETLDSAVNRILSAKADIKESIPEPWTDHKQWALEAAGTTVLRGDLPRLGSTTIRLLEVIDNKGREIKCPSFADALKASGVKVIHHCARTPEEILEFKIEEPLLLAVSSPMMWFKNRTLLAEELASAIKTILGDLKILALIIFGSPYIDEQLNLDGPTLCAYGPSYSSMLVAAKALLH